jgi:hypothetical protein
MVGRPSAELNLCPAKPGALKSLFALKLGFEQIQMPKQ